MLKFVFTGIYIALVSKRVHNFTPKELVVWLIVKTTTFTPDDFR